MKDSVLSAAAAIRGPREETGDFVARRVEERFELQTDSEGEGVPGVNVNYHYVHV